MIDEAFFRNKCNCASLSIKWKNIVKLRIWFVVFTLKQNWKNSYSYNTYTLIEFFKNTTTVWIEIWWIYVYVISEKWCSRFKIFAVRTHVGKIWLDYITIVLFYVLSEIEYKTFCFAHFISLELQDFWDYIFCHQIYALFISF